VVTQHRPERRARSVALIGLVFQVALTAFLLILSIWGASQSLRAVTLMSGVGMIIWFFLVLIYQQKVLVQEEAFESEQLRKEREAGIVGGAIFEEDETLLLARRRLLWMYRWLLPLFMLLTVFALIAAAWISWPWGFAEPLDSSNWWPVRNDPLLIWFVGGIAFLSFLFSRYAIGMSRLPGLHMLRAGASWLMGVTLMCVAVVVVLCAYYFGHTITPEHLLAKIIRGLMLVLGAEIVLNFILDLYRPRTADEEPRPAFDSRLLGLFSEPGGIARSLADAINYQFGFEVSSTWFYKLLQRSVIPLLGFAVAVLLLASCLVFIDVNEQGVVERMGRRLEGTLQPGLHFKYPWPIDTAYKVETAQVHELKIGVEPPKEEDAAKKDELILWTNKHSQEPHLEVLVATPKLASYIRESAATRPSVSTEPAAMTSSEARPAGTSRRAGQAVAVSLMRIAVSLQYTIRDAYQWLTTYDHPEDMLNAIANREINRYCASVDVNGLIGGQRGAIEEALHKTIQQKADAAGLGVNIVFLGLQGVHPPESTAQDFQDVVGAEQKKSATIRSAQAEYNKRLSEVAGDVTRAQTLSKAIVEANLLAAKGDDSAAVEKANARVNELFFGDAGKGMPPAGGKAAQIRETAKADRWKIENAARGRAATFEQEIAASKAAPQVYRTRKLLDAMMEAGDSLRKYIISGDSTLLLNLQDPMSAPMETAVEQK
jgi:regulator of protease activity HflC (stomatin/prohibitin superfamily)